MQNVELDEVQWRSPEWIQAFGLRTDNVLDYFALSPFYDRSSNNQVLKMQSNFNEQLQTRGPELMKELQKMTGVEYQVMVAREPDLWVIFKQNRTSPTDTEVIAVYFVTGENIYQSPSIYNVLVSRILATSKYLEEALQIAEQLPQFTPSGYEYNSKRESQGSKRPEKDGDGIKNDNESSAILERSLKLSTSLLRSRQYK